MEEELSGKICKALSVLEKESEACKLTSAIQELAEAIQERPDNCQEVLLYYVPPAEMLLKQAMDEHQDDLELQQAACLAIAEFVPLNEEFRDRFEGEKIYLSVLRCVRRFQSDNALQAWGCQAIACLAQTMQNRTMMIANGDAGALAFSALNTHRDDVSVQENACKAISYIVRDDEDYQLDIVQRKGYVSSLLETLSLHGNDENVVEQTFWALRALASADEAQKFLLEFRHDPPIYKLAVTAMRNFDGEEGVQSATCGILEALCSNAQRPILSSLVDDLDAFELVTDAMEKFADSPQIQWFGCSLVAYLVSEAIELGRKEIDDYILELIYEAMKRHEQVEEDSALIPSTGAAARASKVQEAACRALSEVLHLRPFLRDQIGEDLKSDVKAALGGDADEPDSIKDKSKEDYEPKYPIEEHQSNFQLQLHQSVMYVIMCYMNDPYIFKSACDAIYSMAIDCERIQKLLVLSGAQEACLIGMQTHASNSNVQQWGCKALQSLSAGSDEFKLRLKQCGGLDAVVRILYEFKSDRNHAHVLEEAVSVVACLATIDSGSVSIEVQSTVLDIMQMFMNDEHLQQVALEALAAFVSDLSSESPVLEFNVKEVWRCTIRAMEQHIGSAGVQQMGCFVLRHLLDPKLLENSQVCNQIASVVSRTLEKHCDNLSVLAEACRAVFKLAHATENIAQMFIKHRVHMQLFNILEKGPNDILETAFDCVIDLGVDLNLRNDMLVTAVEEGRLNTIDALLEIGADPNEGGSNSGFFLACRHGNARAVQHMLKKGVSDIQPGLTIAKERGHHWVVGLLLCHAFLKSDGMFWGNLGLDALNPLWFYESLKLSPPDLPYTPEDELDNDKLQEKFRRLSSERHSSAVLNAEQEDNKRNDYSEYIMVPSASALLNASGERDVGQTVDCTEEDEDLSDPSSSVASELNDARLDISASDCAQPDLTMDVPTALSDYSTTDECFPDTDAVVERQPKVDVAALRESASHSGKPLDLSHDLDSDSCSSSRKSSVEEQNLTNSTGQAIEGTRSRRSYPMRRSSMVRSPELPTVIDQDEDYYMADDETDNARKERDKKVSGASQLSCGSTISACGPPSRKSVSVGSTSSYTSMLSETDQLRRFSQPERLSSCLQKPFVCGKITVNLEGVESLEDAKSIMRKAALEMRKPVISNQEPWQSQTKDHIFVARRMSRCDAVGLPLEPMNVDVGMVKRPNVSRERRRSLAGTFSGADLLLAKPNATLCDSPVRPFSPKRFVRLLKGREATRDQMFEEEAVCHSSGCTPPTTPNLLRQTPVSQRQSPIAGLSRFEERFTFEKHPNVGSLPDGGSNLTTPADSEDDVDSRGPPTPRQKLGVSLGKPKRPTAVQCIDISANDIGSLSSLTGDTELMKKLKDVTHLDLSQNKLTDLPATLKEYLWSLKSLSISCNDFERLPWHLLEFFRLQELAASHNKIEAIESRPDIIASTNSCPLKVLDVSHNKMKLFPIWLSSVAGNLVDLNLSNNSIAELPERPLELYCLKTLVLAYNGISVVPEQLLTNCRNLERLDLTKNELSCLPSKEVAASLDSLSQLVLPHNHVGINGFPEFVLELKRLSNLDMSDNELTILPPPAAWKTSSLSVLLLAENRISEIDLGSDDDKQWLSLKRINLQKNQLSVIPASVGRLTSLGSLDVSHNKGITDLPIQIGKLSQLWDLPLDGLKISSVPFEVSRGRTMDLVRWLRQSLDNSEEYYHIRMITMGGRGQGKTSVLSKITGQTLDSNHSHCGGIAVSEWRFRNPLKKKRTALNLASRSRAPSNLEYVINCWEFVSRQRYVNAHQCFLTTRVVYLVVYKLTGRKSELKEVEASLLNIEAHARNSTVLVIGTHLDKVSDEYADEVHMQLSDLKGKPGFPTKVIFLEVDARTSSPLSGLQDQVIDAIVDAKDESNQPLLGRQVPRKYMHLETLVKEEAERLAKLRTSFPCITRLDFDVILRTAELQVEQRVQAARFLHENGVVVHFEDPCCALDELYILDAGWFCDMVARVGELKSQRVEGKSVQAMVHRNTLSALFRGDSCQQFLRILERFDIALPFDHEEFLVPSLLSSMKPTVGMPVGAMVHRQYCMKYIPTAFWFHLIARLILFAQDIIQVVMSPAKKHPLADVHYWNKGIYSIWREDAYLVVEEGDENVVDICVPTTTYGSSLLVNVVTHLDSLIEEWYPGLSGIDIYGDPLVKRHAPCPACSGIEVHRFELTELITASTQGDSVDCPVHKRPVSLLQLAPDVMLDDIEKSKVVKRFHYDTSSNYQLGFGSFGNVYKAVFRKKPVAVKAFRMPDDTVGIDNPHYQLRQEVNVLRLCHPSIVKLEGVTLRPNRVLLLEFAPYGTLRSHLKRSHKTFGRQLQHRIALQVAEGIDFLHQNRIIYRDLKFDNVLLFSTNPNASVTNVKLTDFGIACHATPSGVVEQKGTPGSRAPEVIREQPYGLAADVYSLGLFLFELATNGHKLFADVSESSGIDELIDLKSASIPGSSVTDLKRYVPAGWPDMQDLIDCCLQEKAEDRPTSLQVCERLNKTEFLCLKKVIRVATEADVAAIAVRKANARLGARGKLEVWMGSGEGQTGQLSKVDLTECHSEAAENVAQYKSRVMAVVAVRTSLVLAGTAGGKIMVHEVNKDVPVSYDIKLPDTVLCLLHFADSSGSQVAGGVDWVLAGLANGQVAIFDTNCLYSKTETPTFWIRLGYHPVSCICTAKKKFWFSHGTEVVVFRHNNLKQEERRWTANDDTSTGILYNVSHVVASSKHVWTTAKHSPIVRRWGLNEPAVRGEINCSDQLRFRGGTVHRGADSSYIYRVTSLLLVPPNEALWVGTGSGHIAICCPVKLLVLLVLHRSVQPVRSMAVVKLEDEGKPMHLVVAGCQGFRRQDQSDTDVDMSRQEHRTAYLLVWERDLHRQEQTLENYRKKRMALLEQ